MFIGVGWYKHDNSISNEINIFDTEDCTVERVSATELYESGVGVHNVDFYLLGGIYSARPFSQNFLSAIPGGSASIKGFCYDMKSGMFKVQGTTFWVQDNYRSYVNDTLLKNKSSMILSYMFRWRDYIILRYIEVASRKVDGTQLWYSVAIERGSGELVAEWSEDLQKICTDKALATQVDTVSEV